MRPAFTVAALGLWLLATLTISGCPFMPPDNPVEPPPVESFRPRTSAENLLANLKTAYSQRDIAEYESLLTPDFAFYFTEQDQSNPDIGDSWGRDYEIEAHASMFDGEFVHTLTLDFDMGTPRFDEESFNGTDSLWISDIANLDLDLFGTPPNHPGETPQWYRVQDGQATFWFRKTLWATDSGNPIWAIAAIEETTTDSP
jgi:hypothetical protein